MSRRPHETEGDAPREDRSDLRDEFDAEARMTRAQGIADWSQQQQELWARVVQLWDLAKVRDTARIESALHPHYVGWDMSTALPHDRNAALQSVGGDSPGLGDYELRPLSVRIYAGRTGVVHYTYAATVMPAGAAAVHVEGKWTEVYVRENGAWVMVAVAGRPDPQKAGA
jgi:hypothetical protein